MKVQTKTVVWNESVLGKLSFLAVTAMSIHGITARSEGDSRALPSIDPDNEKAAQWWANASQIEQNFITALYVQAANSGRGTNSIAEKLHYPVGHAEAYAASVDALLAMIDGNTPYPISADMEELARAAANVPANEQTPEQWAEALLASIRGERI